MTQVQLSLPGEPAYTVQVYFYFLEELYGHLEFSVSKAACTWVLVIAELRTHSLKTSSAFHNIPSSKWGTQESGSYTCWMMCTHLSPSNVPSELGRRPLLILATCVPLLDHSKSLFFPNDHQTWCLFKYILIVFRYEKGKDQASLTWSRLCVQRRQTVLLKNPLFAILWLA